MAQIRIIAVPPGDAPLEIRQAWVGLILPLANERTGQQTFLTKGVLSDSKGFLANLLSRRIAEGYAVYTLEAVDVLAQANPSAAQWWKDNTAHLLQPGRKFVFAASVCQEVVE